MRIPTSAKHPERKQTFTRTGAFLTEEMHAALRPEMPGSFSVHTITGAVEVFAASFQGVDLVAVQAAVDAVPVPVKHQRIRDELEGDLKFRVLVKLLAQHLGVSESVLRGDIRTILAGL